MTEQGFRDRTLCQMQYEDWRPKLLEMTPEEKERMRKFVESLRPMTPAEMANAGLQQASNPMAQLLGGLIGGGTGAGYCPYCGR